MKEIVSRRMDVATARVLLLAGIAGGVAACGGAQGEPPEEVADRGDGYRRVVNVEVQRVETTNFTSTIPLTGVALAMRDVMV
ncbi:MAG: hypothetical protein F4123_03305, partial [Gemmatimonadetes bacterium]|nr:hypothetical protein [Gemmatimonadota bacterium]